MEGGDIAVCFYPNGKTAYLWGSLNRGAFAGYFLDLDSGQFRQVTRQGVSPFLFQAPISTDGQWVALLENVLRPNGASAFTVLHPDGSGERTYEWLQRGEAISSWGADSNSLIVWDRNRLPAVVERLELATGRRTRVAQLSPPDPAGVPGIQGIFLSQDGKRYAYNIVRKLSQLYTIEGLK